MVVSSYNDYLFVGFHVNNSDDSVISIQLKNHIKFIFISILYQIYNFRYSRYILITNRICLESFTLIINLDVVSSSNVFSFLISMFKYNIISLLSRPDS